MNSVAMSLFHEWARCCSILSTPLNPALIAILSVRLSVTRMNQSKTAQARITKSSLSAA